MTRLLPPSQWRFALIGYGWLVFGFMWNVTEVEGSDDDWHAAMLPVALTAWLGRITGLGPRGGMSEF